MTPYLMQFTMSLSRRVFITALSLLTLTLLLSAACGQSVSVNVSDFAGQHSQSRLAYYRWRSWLLGHPAVLNKVPPMPKKTQFTFHSPRPDVMAQLFLSYLQNVDDYLQRVQVAVRLDVWWQDPALALDPQLVNDFTDGQPSHLPHSVALPAQSLWLPQLTIMEGVSVVDVLEEVSRAEVQSDGFIFIGFPLVFTFTCPLRMHDYPFDQHDCVISLIDASSTANVITAQLYNFTEIAERFSVEGDWEVVSVAPVSAFLRGSQLKYSQFVMRIKRKTTFYVIVIILPMVLASYLNVLVFLLPPDLGDKTSYLVTINISLSVFTSFFNQDMPRGLDSVPQIFRLLIFVLVESVVALIVTLVVLRKYKREQEQQETEARPTSGAGGDKKSRVSPSMGEVSREGGRPCCRRFHAPPLSARQLDGLAFVFLFIANTLGIIAILAPLL